MGMPRKLAAKLLRAAIRLAPPQSREWAAAMLRELDFIEGDWAALFWALGSFGAIFRHAATEWRAYFTNQEDKEIQMNETGKKAIGFASGALLALVVSLSGLGLLWILAILFPGLGIDHLEWTHFLGAIVIPEIIFVVSAVLLWRKRTPVAAGILLTGIGIAIHVAVHLATH